MTETKSPGSRKTRTTSTGPSEDDEQKAVVDWAHRYRPPGQVRVLATWLIHIPNGGSRHKLEAVKFKRMGVKAGVSDLFLAYVSTYQPYFGFWIEMKRRRDSRSKPRLTAEQEYWLQLMREQGYAAEVAYGAEQAVHLLKSYCEGRM